MFTRTPRGARYFANARDFRKRALAAADAHPAALHWFVLNVEANVDIDITAMDAVEEVRAKLVDRGVMFALARVKQDILGPLQTYGLADRVGADGWSRRCRPRRPPTAPGRASWLTVGTGPRQPTLSRTRGLTLRRALTNISTCREAGSADFGVFAAVQSHDVGVAVALRLCARFSLRAEDDRQFG
jgi:MFS superfamily sulfate permease-like transporter